MKNIPFMWYYFLFISVYQRLVCKDLKCHNLRSHERKQSHICLQNLKKKKNLNSVISCCGFSFSILNTDLPFLAGWLKESGQSRLFLWRSLWRDFWFLRRLLRRESLGATVSLRSWWLWSDVKTVFTWNRKTLIFKNKDISRTGIRLEHA